MDIDLDSDSDEQQETSLIRDVIEFCGGPDIIQLFGETGGGKTVFCTNVADSAINEGKDVLFIDTEKNLGDNEKLDGADYIYIPDFEDIYAYIGRKEQMLSDNPFGENTTGSNTLPSGYDVIILDSLGLPALMQYNEYSIVDDADQFQVFQMIQFISGQLKIYAQKNDSLIMVTNQPKSELSDSSGPVPFGDKSQFAFKELWKAVKKSSSEIQTTCVLEAHRSRQAGNGKDLFQLEIDDSGVDITSKYDDSVEDQADEWTA